MADNPIQADFQKVIEWAKTHKQIAIPAVVIGGAGVLYLVSKQGGLQVGSGTLTNGQAAAGSGSDTSGSGSDGQAASDNGVGTAIADLQNQLGAQQAADAQALSQLQNAQGGILGQVQQALNSVAGQVNSALQQQQGQQAQFGSALQSLESQAQQYGQNGIGQPLAPIAQFVAPQQQSGSYTPAGFTDAAQSAAEFVGGLFHNVAPVSVPTSPGFSLGGIGAAVGGLLGNLGNLSGYSGNGGIGAPLGLPQLSPAKIASNTGNGISAAIGSIINSNPFAGVVATASSGANFASSVNPFAGAKATASVPGGNKGILGNLGSLSGY